MLRKDCKLPRKVKIKYYLFKNYSPSCLFAKCLMCRYPEYFTKQGKYIWENGLEGQVEDIMEKIPCSREMAVEYVYIMGKKLLWFVRHINGIRWRH